MPGGQKILLFKIASEINLGKEAIVDFLKSKGFDIVNKPTATLSPEMVDAIYDKFKREKKAAEVQREKLLKHKETRHPRIIDEKDKKPQIISDEAAKHAAAELRAEQIEKQFYAQAEKAAEAFIEPELEDKVDKIDEVIHKKEAAKPDEIIKKELPEKKDEKELTELEKAEQVKKRAKDKKKDEKVEEQVIIGKDDVKQIEPISEELPEIPSQEMGLEPKEGITEISDKLPEEQEESKEHHKKRKKRKKIVEFAVEPGTPPQLRGLTIVGKIDLQAERDKKEKQKAAWKKKGVPATPEEEEEGLAKLKSKIKKKVVKVKGKDKLQQIVEFTREEDKKKKKRSKRSIRELISQDEIDRAIRETLSGMETHALSMRAKLRQRKKLEREEKESRLADEREKAAFTLQLTEFVTTSDLANLINVNVNDIILKCLQLGLMVTINQRLDKETITLIADDLGYEVEFVDRKAQDAIDFEEEEDADTLKPRSPIVTIMGHVDHGKTSLLDYIRSANVVAGEAGGITQHIAAYRVQLPNNKYISFLDTPGHEAFTAMRARGAQVTDIVVLVVAADDSVMPQTLEAISHAQAAKVPIIVAINKIDKPDARPDRIKQQLADQKILVEEWGGKYQSVEISAKKGINIDQLLEKILLEAELLDLKANPDRKAKGTVIEAHMAKGLGSVATVIVQKGTLKVGDAFVAGANSGRVRVLLDERGNKLEFATPSLPVGVIGFEGLPEAGDILTAVDTDTEARSISAERQKLRREQDLRQKRHLTLDDISREIQLGGVKDLNLIIKGDVGGSVEALSDSLMKLSREEVRVNILHQGVGTIKETDVMLAAASGAIIIGFNVSTTTQARKIAEKEDIEIRHYDIIYNCINDIQLALEGLLSPDIKEEVIATIEIRKVFKITKLGSVAGCYVLSGKLNRNDKVRVLRDGLTIFSGTIHSLKRGKDDVREIDTGYECGIQLQGFDEIQPNDIIEGYKVVEVKRTFE